METENKIIFYMLDNDNLGCDFAVRIIIKIDLNVRAMLRRSEVPSCELMWLLPKNCKAGLCSQILNLLSRYKYERASPSDCFKDCINKVIFYLEKANC